MTITRSNAWAIFNTVSSASYKLGKPSFSAISRLDSFSAILAGTVLTVPIADIGQGSMEAASDSDSVGSKFKVRRHRN